MHMLIRALVPAANTDQASYRAKTDVFDNLVGERVFDYYVTADMDGRGISGTDRWGQYPEAEPVDTQLGRQLAEDGWEATVDEYESAMDRIHAFFDGHEDAELWDDQSVHAEYQYAFHRVGQFRGSSTYLYDEHGQGVRDRGHLDRYLSGEAVQTADEQVYVVPADVHY